VKKEDRGRRKERKLEKKSKNRKEKF